MGETIVGISVLVIYLLAVTISTGLIFANSLDLIDIDIKWKGFPWKRKIKNTKTTKNK